MNAKSFAAGITTLAVAAIMPATAFAGYAPSARPTFTCASPTVCEGADYVTFNSFTNAPEYGDERAFFDVKDAGITTAGGYQDSMAVKDGQRVTLRIYVHNNADPNVIGKDNAVAKNTKVQVMLPTSKKTTAQAGAVITADNAQPGAVSDTIDLTGARPFTLSFDTAAPATITYRPNGQGAQVTRDLPNSIVSFANNSTMNANFGDWNGCFEYSAIITVTAVVHMDSTPPTTPPTTTTTSSKPTTLPNTGAGDVAAIAAGATAAGMLGYRRFLSRRLSR